MALTQVFKTSDGQTFDSEEAALRYESQADKKPLIDAWAESFYTDVRLRKKNANVVMAWEAYRTEALEAVPE